jgi:hypothetical protein
MESGVGWMAVGQFVDAWRGGAEEDSGRVLRCQPRYLNAGSSSFAAEVVLAETHHAVRAGEPGLIYQGNLFEAASRCLRGALFLRERSFEPKPLMKGRLVRGGGDS